MRLTAYLYAALWATDIARAFGGFAFLRRHGAPAPAAAATDVVAPPEPHAAAEPLVACRDDAAPREDPHLESLRRSIDNFDAAIVHLLAERFKVTKAVGEYKAKAGLVASDPEREARQVARLRRLADEAGLDPEFSEKFLRFIVHEVINHHKQIKKKVFSEKAARSHDEDGRPAIERSHGDAL